MMQPSTDVNNRTRIINRSGRWGLLLAAPAIAVTMFVGAAAPNGNGGKLLFTDARMLIEFNSTDEDVGIQVNVDGEPWRLLRVFNPQGLKILEITGTRSLRLQGLTVLFFESSEPSLDELTLEEFLARFPEGEYDFEGITIDGEEIEGEAIFTHAIPDGPVILSPGEGSLQNVNNTIVSWEDVPDPDGSEIVAYQVIVTQLLNVLPKRTFSVHVSAAVTSVRVPSQFLVRGANYEFEVLAIEAGGNQTLTSSVFSTLP